MELGCGRSEISVAMRRVAVENDRVAYDKPLRRLPAGADFNMSLDDDQALKRARRIGLKRRRMMRREGKFVELDEPSAVVGEEGTIGHAAIA